ncbi:cell division protein FtsL [Parabacteroides sp. PFB2-12]|nr:cell division protein FtsL [Parabacteroides sp. PM6-13]MDH6390210.1 cell division protein FtsL [Parabacteroides sp. PFB2-12]
MRTRCILFYLICSFFPTCLFAQSLRIDSMLHILDQEVVARSAYSLKKERDLQSLKELLRMATTDEQRYTIYGQLVSGYIPFNNDSSLYYVTKKWELAQSLNEKYYLQDAQMSLAEVMSIAGMYKEAFDIMTEVDIAGMEELNQSYYHVFRKLYGYMADHAVTPSEKEKYQSLTDCYRDSILINSQPESDNHVLVLADKLTTHGKGEEAVSLLLERIDTIEPYSHNAAVFNFTLAKAYETVGDIDAAIYYYAISALSDLRSAVKEYISLRHLSQLLFEKGDITRAYAYLKCSLEDAIESNARMRAMEVSQIFPIIDEAHQLKVAKQQQLSRLFLVSVSILSLFLLIALFLIARQMRKTSQARQAVTDANNRLILLNKELNNSNQQLQELNHILSETNSIKEEYIGRYMDLCSAYIDKQDDYRRSLAKIAGTGKLEELYKKIKSTQFLEEELKEFYTNFDDTFLKLFPAFVEDFNILLTEGIQPKPGEKLNTELRIYALIRLGITDSNKIARFLRYSVTTIYNYRTRIRNKAKGERDDFENKVMGIGRVNY